jgi:hypothetical protein
MLLQHLTTNVMIQSRMMVVSGSRQAFSTVTAELPGNLQPLGDYNDQLDVGAYGREFVFYCDVYYDLKSGDRLRDTSTGLEYVVRGGGVVTRSQGSIEYLKVICTRS